MIRARTFLVICALALPIALVAAGCGGGASDRDPREVIESTLDNDTKVTSGVIDFSLDGTVTGEESGNISATLSGPFQSEADAAEGSLPQLDVTGSVTGEGGGESIDESAHLIVTDANAFVEYAGTTYEAGEEMFASLQEEFAAQAEEANVDEEMPFRQVCEQAVEQAGGDPAACDFDVIGDWLTNLENQGTEEIEGVETVHVSGEVDVERMLTDLAELGAAAPELNTQAFDPAQLAPAIPEASFDLYSGVDDEELRRLEVRLVVDPSAVTGGVAVVPIDQVDLDLTLAVSEVNEAQTIEAPSGRTQPLDRLLGGLGVGSVGGLGTIPDLGGGGGADESAPAPPSGGSSSGTPENVDPEQAQEYLDCIEQAAESGDQEALDACTEQL